MNTKHPLHLPLAAGLLTLAALTGLTGCNRQDDQRTVGQKLDSAIATTEQKAKQAQAEGKQSAAATSDKIQGTVGDAAITAKITTALVADAELKAHKIDVETQNGVVTLTGQAPSLQALNRATDIAKAVGGATQVNNKLTVNGSMAEAGQAQ